ncbi:MAG TPA: hypothetical protein PLU53_10070 [Bacteroidia bacterium]|nr:hypothetical protein [Bacteroidia bacterium]
MKNFYVIFLLLIPFFTQAQLSYHHGFGLGYTGNDNPGSVKIDAQNNVLVVGSFTTYIDMDPGLGTTALNANTGIDGFVGKYTSSGTLLWAFSIGGTGNEGVSSINIDGSDIVIVGSFNDTVDVDPGPGTTNLVSAGNYDFFIARYTSTGQFVSAKRFGGSGDESFMDMDMQNGSMTITGWFEDTLALDTFQYVARGSNDVFVAKLNSAGDVLWSHTFGGTGFSLSYGRKVIIDSSGIVYATGTINATNIDVDPGPGIVSLSTTGSSDIYIIQYLSNGDLGWARLIGGSTGELAGDIEMDRNGDLFVAGYTNSDSLDMNPDTSATAFLYELPGINGAQDMIVGKYTSTGQYVWAHRTGKRSSDTGWGIEVDEINNLFVCASFGDDSVDFDPGPGIFLMSTDSGVTTAGALVQYNGATGNFVDAISFGGNGQTLPNDLALSNGKVWVTGIFRGDSMDLDPGVGTAYIYNHGTGATTDAFIAGYNYGAMTRIQELRANSLKLYPSLTKDMVNITFDEVLTQGIVEVRNTEGKLILREKVNSFPYSISVKNFAAGLYVASLFAGEKTYSGKFMKTE